MAEGDRFVLKLKGALNNQKTLNVFGYNQIGAGAGSAADLNAAFGATILPPLVDILSTAFEFTGVETFNVDNDADFNAVEYSPTVPGTVTGDNSFPFAAYTFRYIRASRLYRHGAKRFAGVPEAATVNGVDLATGYPALVDAVAAVLEADLDGSTADYRPRIIRRTKTDPITYDVFGAILSVAYVHLGTQNSRKVGRGE